MRTKLKKRQSPRTPRKHLFRVTLGFTSYKQLGRLLTQIEAIFISTTGGAWDRMRGKDLADFMEIAALQGRCDVPVEVLHLMPIYRELVKRWPHDDTLPARGEDQDWQQEVVRRLLARAAAKIGTNQA